MVVRDEDSGVWAEFLEQAKSGDMTMFEKAMRYAKVRHAIRARACMVAGHNPPADRRPPAAGRGAA